MSEVPSPSSQQPSSLTLSPQQEAAKTHAMVAYVLMLLGLFTGIFWIAGAIWAMVKKSDAAGTGFEDHYANIIKVFWVGLALTLLSILLAVILIGYLMMIAVAIWSIYRIVKGLARLTSNRTYYSYSTGH